LPEKQKTPPKPKKGTFFTMKRAKQRYRVAANMMMEGFRMPPLKEWIKKHYKSFGDVKMTEKLEKLVLQ
jgi:hypothetical protein